MIPRVWITLKNWAMRARHPLGGLDANIRTRLAISLGLALLLAFSAAAETLPLAGEWSYRADPRDAGLTEGWHTQPFTNRLVLPGVTPATVATGALWLAREVEIPGHWQNRRIRLTLEGCPLVTQLWVDGELAGRCETAVGPHEYELGDRLYPGRHRLVLRLARPLPQMPFLGIAGRMELATAPKVGITRLQVKPDPKNNTVQVSVTLENQFAGEGDGWVAIQSESFTNAVPHKTAPLRMTIPIGMGMSTGEFIHDLGPDARLWILQQPALYRLKFWLGGTVVDRPVDDEAEVVFGLRSVKALAAPDSIVLPLMHCQLNGQPVVLLSRDLPPHFPLRAHPPMDAPAWRALFDQLRREGVGHIRFPGWCPPEAAFRAADEAGLLLTPHLEASEIERLRQHFGHHPSLALPEPAVMR